MRRVYKYDIENRIAEIAMHADAKVVKVDWQNSKFGEGPKLWAEVDVTSPVVKKVFYVVATGETVPIRGLYCGTFVDLAGLVFHLYLEQD